MDMLKGLLSKMVGGESDGYSRKWLVVVAATVLMWFAKIDTTTYTIIVGAYLGVQGTADAISSSKAKKQEVPNA